MSILKATIKFTAGRAPLGNLMAVVTDHVTRYIDDAEAGTLSRWCREKGYELKLDPVYAVTLADIEEAITDHIHSGVWKP